MADAEQGRPSKTANGTPSACGAFCPNWLASVSPFPLTQWKEYLLNQFLHSKTSVGVPTIDVYLLLVCHMPGSGFVTQNHLCWVYLQSERQQLKRIMAVVLLTLLIKPNTEAGGGREGKDLETNRRRSQVRGLWVNSAQR